MARLMAHLINDHVAHLYQLPLLRICPMARTVAFRDLPGQAKLWLQTPVGHHGLLNQQDHTTHRHSLCQGKVRGRQHYARRNLVFYHGSWAGNPRRVSSLHPHNSHHLPFLPKVSDTSFVQIGFRSKVHSCLHQTELLLFLSSHLHHLRLHKAITDHLRTAIIRVHIINRAGDHNQFNQTINLTTPGMVRLHVVPTQ